MLPWPAHKQSFLWRHVLRQFIKSIQVSLESGNWIAALSTALTIPDMAGWAQFPDKTAGARYKLWFNQNLADKYQQNIGGHEVTFLNAEDCWALRCSFLHSGQDDITGQGARQYLARFVFGVVGTHLIRVDDVLQLDVQRFCEEFVEATEAWLEQHRGDADITGRLDSMLTVRAAPFEIAPGIHIG